jgi:hypothetical protein
MEESITERLTRLTRSNGGQVEHVGDVVGIDGTKKGDHLLTIEPPFAPSRIRLAFESKDHAPRNGPFSREAIRRECAGAAKNRGAAVVIFLASSAEILPEGSCFGWIDDYLYIACGPATDDLHLATAISLATERALRKVGGDVSSEQLQRLRNEVALLSDLLDMLARLDPGLKKASDQIADARKAAEELRTRLQATIVRFNETLATAPGGQVG